MVFKKNNFWCFSLCFLFQFSWLAYILTINHSKSSNKIHRSIVFFSRLVITAFKTTVLKWEMLLEFMSCVSVTFFTQKTYENNSFCEITQCRQSLCHVCLQCIKRTYRAKMQYCRNCILKKDIRNKPSKAPFSNNIYCTLICDWYVGWLQFRDKLLLLKRKL